MGCRTKSRPGIEMFQRRCMIISNAGGAEFTGGESLLLGTNLGHSGFLSPSE